MYQKYVSDIKLVVYVRNDDVLSLIKMIKRGEADITEASEVRTLYEFLFTINTNRTAIKWTILGERGDTWSARIVYRQHELCNENCEEERNTLLRARNNCIVFAKQKPLDIILDMVFSCIYCY